LQEVDRYIKGVKDRRLFWHFQRGVDVPQGRFC